MLFHCDKVRSAAKIPHPDAPDGGCPPKRTTTITSLRVFSTKNGRCDVGPSRSPPTGESHEPTGPGIVGPILGRENTSVTIGATLYEFLLNVSSSTRERVWSQRVFPSLGSPLISTQPVELLILGRVGANEYVQQVRRTSQHI